MGAAETNGLMNSEMHVHFVHIICFFSLRRREGKKQNVKGKKTRYTILSDEVERVIGCNIVPVEDNSYHSLVFCTGTPYCRLRFILRFQSSIRLVLIILPIFKFRYLIKFTSII